MMIGRLGWKQIDLTRALKHLAAMLSSLCLQMLFVGYPFLLEDNTIICFWTFSWCSIFPAISSVIDGPSEEVKKSRFLTLKTSLPHGSSPIASRTRRKIAKKESPPRKKPYPKSKPESISDASESESEVMLLIYFFSVGFASFLYTIYPLS